MKKLFTALFCLLFSASASFAADLTVTVENLQPAGGIFFTPLWAGFHDGGFDVFNVGGTASSSLIAIAEEGDTAPLMAAFAGSSGGGVDGAVAPGTPFGPAGSSFASSASADFTVDPSSHRYFSFASMVIPSNDGFFGNDDPMAYQLFDGSGAFNGTLVIDIFGANVYDAGSEVNDAMGAAFSALGGNDTDETIAIAMHEGLDNFLNTGTANGETILSGFSADTPIARITVSQAVPEPNASWMAMLGLPALGLLRRRRR